MHKKIRFPLLFHLTLNTQMCVCMLSRLPASSVHRIFQAEILKCSCHALFQGIFLTQGSNPHLLHLHRWEADSLPLSHLGSPELKYSPHTLLQTMKCGFLVLKHGILFFPHDTRLSATPLTIYQSFHPFSTFSPRPGIRLDLLKRFICIETSDAASCSFPIG